MQNVRVVENPISGKILVISADGDIMEAVHVAVGILNDRSYRNTDINFSCDYGQTAIDFPAGDRAVSYTAEEFWDIVSNLRGEYNVIAPKPPAGPSP